MKPVNQSEHITVPDLLPSSSSAPVFFIPLLRNGTHDAIEPLPVFYKSLQKLIPARPARLSAQLPLDKKANRLLKRAADIFISLFVLLFIFPWLLPVLALVIRIDSKGPVFFLQKRAGRSGTLFTCIKLRSMIQNEEADLKPAGENDARITRVGKFLRNHYLDELPQFINVLLGHMSVIGPRPHMNSDNERFASLIEHYSLRHKVKPGITGLAQALGYMGCAEDQDKLRCRIQLDIIYTRHWSPGLDCRVAWLTLQRLAGWKKRH